MRSYFLPAVLLVLGCSDWRAVATPYATDDAEIADRGNLELALFSQGSTNDAGASGTNFGLEMEYGLLPGLEARLAQPVGSSTANRDHADLDPSQVEFELKYALLSDENSALPIVAIAPSVELPFRKSGKSAGGATHFFLPVWVQKSFQEWTLRGGAGLRTNPEHDGKNIYFGGIGFTKAVIKRISFGAEVFVETAPDKGEGATSGYNVCATYDITDCLQLGLSAGSGLGHESSLRGLDYYIGVKWEIQAGLPETNAADGGYRHGI